MQKLKRCKKGFTLTELAIVIAVIAILIAVLVPTFVSLINSANNSADEQTVKNMNTALSVDEAENGTPAALCGVWEVLEDAGYNPTSTPTYKDNEFYWYEEVNRIVIVSTESQTITFPAEYEGLAAGDTVSSTTDTALCKTALCAETTSSAVTLTALDTDEDLYSVHHFENGECTICHKDRTVQISANSDIGEILAKSGWVSLSEDLSIDASSSALLTSVFNDSDLEDISIDLNDQELTITGSQLQIKNNQNTYDETGYLISSVAAPLDTTISNGTINCSYSGSGTLRFEAGNNVVFENVTFKNVTFKNTASSSGSICAIQIASSKVESRNNYTFINCTFENTYVNFQGSSGKINEYNVIFQNCEFTNTCNSANCCVNFNAYCYGSVLIDSCTFNITLNCANTATAAIGANTNSSAGTGNALTITLKNVTFTGTSYYYSIIMTTYKPFVVYISNASYATVTEEGTNTYTVDGSAINYDGTTPDSE